MDVIIKGLEKSFDQVRALKPTDLHIKKGRFTTLLGPSGCGKTTLLRMIAGLDIPDRGEIYVGEDCYFSSAQKLNKPAHRRNFGMVFQDFALWPHMTVFENVAFSLRASGRTKDIKLRVQEAVEMVRLQGMEKRYPHQLSGGQQQRVAFARAVAMRPQLVLFDEPLSALDAVLRDEMRIELTSLVRDIGLTALYVTHDQVEAMSMSDEIVVMQEGQILQMGAPEDIYHRPSHPFVAQFIGKSNWLVKNEQVFRPEHIRFLSEGDEEQHKYLGNIHAVSYVGDRYEIALDMGSLGSWIAYHDKRLPVGDTVQIAITKSNIHYINGN